MTISDGIVKAVVPIRARSVSALDHSRPLNSRGHFGAARMKRKTGDERELSQYDAFMSEPYRDLLQHSQKNQQKSPDSFGVPGWCELVSSTRSLNYGFLFSGVAGGVASAGFGGGAAGAGAFGASNSFIRSCSFWDSSSFGANSTHLSNCCSAFFG